MRHRLAVIMHQQTLWSPMNDARRLALLILVDALLTVAVVHRAQQHAEADQIRALAVGTITAARARHQAMR